MSKVILICGKICSGKTFYARRLTEGRRAVLLSADEATYDLLGNEQGALYDRLSQRVKGYLRKKAAEIVLAGADVVLDWGFWTGSDRAEISEYFEQNHICYEWHYVHVDNDKWERQIEERNARIAAGNGGSDFYLDAGLTRKLLSLFEEPGKGEMDVWHVNR